MSWSVNFNGNTSEVTEAFDKQRAQSASYGMIEAELKDIDAVRDLVANFAERCGRVAGSANGHWINTHTPADTPPYLGQVQVTISLSKQEVAG
jgi:hypothetical protein